MFSLSLSMALRRLYSRARWSLSALSWAISLRSWSSISVARVSAKMTSCARKLSRLLSSRALSFCSCRWSKSSLEAIWSRNTSTSSFREQSSSRSPEMTSRCPASSRRSSTRTRSRWVIRFLRTSWPPPPPPLLALAQASAVSPSAVSWLFALELATCCSSRLKSSLRSRVSAASSPLSAPPFSGASASGPRGSRSGTGVCVPRLTSSRSAAPPEPRRLDLRSSSLSRSISRRRTFTSAHIEVF
mmetsp:Transcript_13256/g.37421  ORF Transcript_13256/g.37421 Transcript_13256/m.37421 type:complete len:244 (-) Transcript_13256:566-1297(-)